MFTATCAVFKTTIDILNAGSHIMARICRVPAHGNATAVVAYTYRRSLIASSDTGSAWTGSLSRGSESGSFCPDNAETELAVLSTRAIQSLFNEVDIIFAETGAMTIENKPTPAFFADRDREKPESAVRLILKSLAH